MKELRGGLEGAGMRIGVVVSRFNAEITDRLREGALAAMTGAGVKDVTTVSVPGAFEIPAAARRLALSGRVDAVVCLGAVIRGETEHFTFVAGAAAQGILQASLEAGIPMTFGVLTTEDVEQAMDRSGGEWGNKGEEAALDAIEMVDLYRQIG